MITDFPTLNCKAGKFSLRDNKDKASDIVAALTAYGVGIKEVAKYLECREETIREEYGRELELGRTAARLKVHNFLYTAASGDALKNEGLKATFADCVRAAIFYAKAQMGWSDNINIHHSGEVKTVQTLSDSELERMILDGAKGEIEQSE
jgi:hypothetical protein